jgi:dTDP-4-amino-4,6-dideoxygalactose transaminase
MVKMVGAKPIYCDCAPGSVNPSLAELREKATPRTKAVIVCHTYGALLETKKHNGTWKRMTVHYVLCI